MIYRESGSELQPYADFKDLAGRFLKDLSKMEIQKTKNASPEAVTEIKNLLKQFQAEIAQYSDIREAKDADALLRVVERQCLKILGKLRRAGFEDQALEIEDYRGRLRSAKQRVFDKMKPTPHSASSPSQHAWRGTYPAGAGAGDWRENLRKPSQRQLDPRAEGGD